MMNQSTILSLIAFVINMILLFVGNLDQSAAFSSSNPTARNLSSITPTHLEASNSHHHQDNNRRTFFKQCGSLLVGIGVESMLPKDVMAKPDCISDCLKNCKLIAPKDPGYCLENCKSYCDQEDRTDGLSGSVSSEGGEMGILGTTTVVKGEDKPPSISIPGLDFTSDKGRKLIGY